ncbi:MAG: Uma2 family endonuclease, partial [Gemmatales bacterium]|nr:Uma2 family endonuclease [Gemmatales bacterium]
MLKKRSGGHTCTPVVSIERIAMKREQVEGDLRDGQRLTLAEYLAWPEDDRFMELIDGVLYMSPSPAGWHQDIGSRLHSLLDRWTLAHALGRVWQDLDVILCEAPAIVYRPDIVYLAKQHMERNRDHRIYG